MRKSALDWKDKMSLWLEPLFRNTGTPYRNLTGLLLGATASILLLSSNAIYIGWASLIFAVILSLTMLVLIIFYREKTADKFAWGLPVIITLGFGLGALVYYYREWFKWLWRQYLRINEPHELLLEALFLLGVILGFFVVRNWAQKQEEFVKSLTAVLAGSFVATVLGEIQQELGPMRAFAYYALGFTMSGTINLMVAARLSASYTNKRSITSRAMLDFLYGSERAKTIDGYFLKNFEEDPDYAKRWLTDALLEYRKMVSREFAERMNARKRAREKALTKLERDIRKLKPKCAERGAKHEEVEKLQAELKTIESSSNQERPKQEARKQEIETRSRDIKREIENLKSQCDDDQLKEWQNLNQQLNQLKPSCYYELIAFEDEKKKEGDEKAGSGVSEKEREYSIIYRHLDEKTDIDENLFRVSIAIRWQDSLEYIVAPGQYRASFPYLGSITGLALQLRQTIVMDRDKYKKFRSSDFKNGISPVEREQDRGLDEIDFLSYMSIPVVSRLGKPTENGLGVVDIDTKIFVTSRDLGGEPIEEDKKIFRIRFKREELGKRREELTTNANYLYEQNDEAVKYIESLTAIVAPVMELYLKCRVGAT